MRTEAQLTGDAAEHAVADHLAAMGWRIVARNLRVGRAELDLVAIDPAPPAELVIVEVRARGRRDYGLPEETLDWRKRRVLRHALAAIRELEALPDGTPVPRLPVRFDLIVAEPSWRPGEPRLRHHRAQSL